MTVPNKRLSAILLAATLMLLAPLIAMQFTAEVQWSPFDFVVAAVLLYGTGLLVELVLRKVRKSSTRIALCVGILLALLIVWAELAVGVFGSPLAGS